MEVSPLLRIHLDSPRANAVEHQKDGVLLDGNYTAPPVKINIWSYPNSWMVYGKSENTIDDLGGSLILGNPTNGGFRKIRAPHDIIGFPNVTRLTWTIQSTADRKLPNLQSYL